MYDMPMKKTLVFHQLEGQMLKAILVGVFLAFAASTATQAAEDCGKSRWRDEYGHCHWFTNPYGTERGTTHACPTWAYWSGGRCVPK